VIGVLRLNEFLSVSSYKKAESPLDSIKFNIFKFYFAMFVFMLLYKASKSAPDFS